MSTPVGQRKVKRGKGGGSRMKGGLKSKFKAFQDNAMKDATFKSNYKPNKNISTFNAKKIEQKLQESSDNIGTTYDSHRINKPIGKFNSRQMEQNIKKSYTQYQPKTTNEQEINRIENLDDYESEYKQHEQKKKEQEWLRKKKREKMEHIITKQVMSI